MNKCKEDIFVGIPMWNNYEEIVESLACSDIGLHISTEYLFDFDLIVMECDDFIMVLDDLA